MLENLTPEMFWTIVWQLLVGFLLLAWTVSSCAGLYILYLAARDRYDMRQRRLAFDRETNYMLDDIDGDVIRITERCRNDFE